MWTRCCSGLRFEVEERREQYDPRGMGTNTAGGTKTQPPEAVGTREVEEEMGREGRSDSSQCGKKCVRK
ncbi:hypothetical protein Pmani_033413 [Petrolisthes manimaculis]|uniref:Uncharacterized protein n=1 Tax=Petrolisthes manimaculis TaxID=1843537 RepID=A0AAE1NR37_9EUCA|nr:hypothetical protein Pmani_033413 [Petrolisthes manimaculis]